MFNKEREGRQLLAVSAASLDLTVEATSDGDATTGGNNTSVDTKSAVVWTGRVEDLQATDPRGSNVLYSTLVGPLPRPPQLPPGREKQEDSSSGRQRSAAVAPVALSFRYAKEKGEGAGNRAGVSGVDLPAAGAGAGVANGCEERGPWESSVLSLSFTELQVCTCP